MAPGDVATWVGVVVAFLVGAGGVLVGWRGLVVAKAAAQAAMRAGEAADRANELAEAALVGDDVAWQLSFGSHGHVTLLNDGNDEAVNARGSVTIDGHTQSFRAKPRQGDVADWGIELQFPELALALAAEEARVYGSVANGFVWDEQKHERSHSVSWRVTWETTRGRTMPTQVRSFENQAVLPGTEINAD